MSEADEEPAKDEQDEEIKALFEAHEQAAKAKDAAQVEKLSFQVFAAIAQKFQKEKPSPWLIAVEKAHRCEAAFDWAGAEAAYRLSTEAKGNSPGLEFSGYDKLSSLYKLLGRMDEAFQAAQQATAAARRCEMTMILSRALQNEADLHLQAGQLNEARALFDEASGLENKQVMKGWIQMSRITLLLKASELDAAEAELEAAWLELEPWRDAVTLVGYQSNLASWWTARASCHYKRGDATQQIEALREAVLYRRRISQAPQLEGPYKINGLAVALHALGRALQENGDALANHALVESRSLRRSIGLAELS